MTTTAKAQLVASVKPRKDSHVRDPSGEHKAIATAAQCGRAITIKGECPTRETYLVIACAGLGYCAAVSRSSQAPKLGLLPGLDSKIAVSRAQRSGSSEHVSAIIVATVVA